MGIGYASAGFAPEGGRVNLDVLVKLAARNAELRAQSTVTVAPLIPTLEGHARYLIRLLSVSPNQYRHELGRLASEMAWLAANAHSDNSSDYQALHWAKLAARLAVAINDEDLRAHAVSRISRTLLSLEQPMESLAALEHVEYSSLSPYGVARIEVHRALALARADTASTNEQAKLSFEALDRARLALTDASRKYARPSWVWWSDDEGFIKSWEAETLRSLTVPSVAEPVFRDAVYSTTFDDNRERPFLQAGLAEVVAQGGALDQAADEAIRAVMLAHAVGADAAVFRIRRLYSQLVSQAAGNAYVRSLGDALHSA